MSQPETSPRTIAHDRPRTAAHARPLITDRCLPIALADIFDSTNPSKRDQAHIPHVHREQALTSAATELHPSLTTKQRGAKAKQPPPRIVIQYPAPAVDDGRYAAKRCVGDTVTVEADIFRDGHDLLRAVVRYKHAQDEEYRESELRRIDAHLGGVRWAGSFAVDREGRWEYTIEAWTDVFGTWRDELERKVAAQQHDLAGELSEGVLLLKGAKKTAKEDPDKALIGHAATALADDKIPESAKHDVALGPELFATLERIQPRHGSVTLPAPITIEVDRLRARFGSWYELFPRSWGGLKGVERELPHLARLGFDILYLPPIHPIGLTNRKGRNNSLVAGPNDPGSPWAIGDATGGHDAVHKDLGTIEDLKQLTQAARKHDIDIALDFAIQCSADHPWLHEHPDWFHRRPDGTLKYAENPPKRYQDIYNVNWESADWKGLWDALLTVVLQWVDAGVKVFRVDNPHTKPFEFWRWLIEHVHEQDRDVIFLAEAFTRRSVMRHLAKIGFTQSYTYFTWKNTRWELALTDESDYFRPNFFANTPDILHEYLQHGGRAAFEARLILAATLSPTYGIYSGYEHYENVPVREGSEEYMNSEKYEIKHRALDGPMLPLIQRVNAIRKENEALQTFTNITFLDTANDALIAYAKQSPGNAVITVVSIDPHQTQEGLAIVPANLGLPPSFTAHDLLTDERYQWRIGPNFVRLEPGVRQAHVVRVEI
jgi:starch synthase (maltosyl-transferring)